MQARHFDHLSDKTCAFRSLTHNDMPFIWDINHEKERFEAQPQQLANICILRWFKQITLTFDASKQGVGAAWLQISYPIAFAEKDTD